MGNQSQSDKKQNQDQRSAGEQTPSVKENVGTQGASHPQAKPNQGNEQKQPGYEGVQEKKK